jgi:phage replication O-like protein O
MTASNLVDFNAIRNGGPPVIADTEDGFTRTANAIQDQLCKLDLSGSQFQLLNAIIRSTYGYNKKQDRVTNTYLAELTDLSDKAVRDGLQVLIDRRIINCEKSGIMKLVSVNKVISEWVLKGTKADSRRKAAVQMHQRSKCTDNAEQMRRQDGANAPEERSKCTDTKDNLPKTTNQRQDPQSPPNGADKPKRAGAVVENGKQWGEQEDVDTVNAMLPYLQATLGEHYRPPNITAWANEIRLMRQQDLRKTSHILQLWRLAHTDEFWRQNVQSPSTLRKQWGKLAVLSNSRKSGLNNSQTGITIGGNGQVMTATDLAQRARELGGMS